MRGLLSDIPDETQCKEIQSVSSLSVCSSAWFSSETGSEFLYTIMDWGAGEHVISHAYWKNLGEPSLRPAQVRLRSATGDDMGVILAVFQYMVGVMRRPLSLQLELPDLCVLLRNIWV